MKMSSFYKYSLPINSLPIVCCSIALSLGWVWGWVSRSQLPQKPVPIPPPAFICIADREERMWCVQPSQIVSIEPEKGWENNSLANQTGSLVRLQTPGFPIHLLQDPLEAAEILKLPR